MLGEAWTLLDRLPWEGARHWKYDTILAAVDRHLSRARAEAGSSVIDPVADRDAAPVEGIPGDETANELAKTLPQLRTAAQHEAARVESSFPLDQFELRRRHAAAFGVKLDNER
jgi:hypothetical protein